MGINMDTKPISEMTAAERVARIAELEAALPQAPEPECVPLFTPGAICFRDGQYTAVSPTVGLVWPLIEGLIARLLEQLQAASGLRHSLEFWHRRFESGCAIPLAFADPEGKRIIAAGIINCELDDDGKQMTGLMVYAACDLDLQHAARIAESIALKFGAERVKVWTPGNVSVVPGYRIEAARYGQLQYAAVRPIQ
jgi:hypothetical protein